MNKSKGFQSIMIPSATVFLSSACIMIIELVAGRLIARHLCSSLYTWTSIIGVVLAGITIGNYFGGRIADKFPARKTLAALFGLASVACVVIIVLNNIVGSWIFLWELSWPVRTFSHVALVFLLPSTMLGTISPVVAKMALDRGLSTGRTVGDIYAWGAAGSIAGTFLAGFYLIAAMGTIAIVWTVAAVLLLMGILYYAKLWPLYIWAVIFILMLLLGTVPSSWAAEAGSSLLLRSKPNPNIIYEDETPYCNVRVVQKPAQYDKRAFYQDKLMHSEVNMDNVSDLQYFYTKIYSGLSMGFNEKKGKPSLLVFGGGGFVFPRHLQTIWPQAKIEAVEIDPGVVEAAMAAFGLDRNTDIKIITLDARNYVDDLLQKKRLGQNIPKYDCIYEDAINDFSVPFQLVTKEFNDKMAEIIADDGVYMVNLIEMYNSGLFLGAVVNTLEKTFPYVDVVASYASLHSLRETFVVAASKKPFNTEDILSKHLADLRLWHLSDEELNALKEKCGRIVITDDYAPVENLLAPVVKQSAKEILARKYLAQADSFKAQQKWEQSIKRYTQAAELNPSMAVKTYNDIGTIQAKLGNITETIKAFEKAIQLHEELGEKQKIIGSIHLNLAISLKNSGDNQKAQQHFSKALKEFKSEANENPNEPLIWERTGTTHAIIGDFASAVTAFKKALALNPSNVRYYDYLATALQREGKVSEAVKVLQQGINLMNNHRQIEAANFLKGRLGSLQYQIQQNKKI
jgi:tetratricopeptide (TPR) repeat protein/MFS family permease